MPKKREINKLEAQRQAEKMILALRAHWIKQVLDWPLKGGPLADRLTKAENAKLRKAAEQGKLFYGSPQSSATPVRTRR
jgi:hypothetical protein